MKDKEDSLEQAENYNNSGKNFYEKGEYDKAIEYFEQALAILRKKLGEEHLYTANTYDNLGKAYVGKSEFDLPLNYSGLPYDDEGIYDKAIECYEKALEIRLKKLGEEHTETVATYDNLGITYASKSEYDKAIKCLEKVLEIRTKKLGKFHMDTGIVYRRLCDVHSRKN